MTDDLLSALARLDARLDRLEQKVDRFSGVAERVERLETLVDAFGTLAERLPTITDAAGTTAAWAWETAEREGIDPITSGQRAAKLALDLGRAENLAMAEKALAAGPVLGKLLDRTDVLEQLLEQIPLLQRLLARRPLLEKVLDAVDAVPEQDLVEVATRGAALTGKLAVLLRSPTLGRVLDATADPKSLETAEAATTALVEARKAPVEQVGLFGTISKLGDPDVKRAVGFTFSMAKRFGQLLAR